MGAFLFIVSLGLVLLFLFYVDTSAAIAVKVRVFFCLWRRYFGLFFSKWPGSASS